MKYLIVFFFFLCEISFAKEKITVGLFEGKPFAYTEEGQVKGITKKLADAILSDSFVIKYVVFPYARVFKELKKGGVDITIMYPNSKIEKNSQRLTGTLGNDNLLISIKDKKIEKLKMIENKRVAVIRSANYGNEFSSIHFNPIEVGNYRQSIRLVLDRRVDAMAISSSAWTFYVKEMGLNEGRFNVIKFNFTQNYIFGRYGLSQEIKDTIVRENEKLLRKYPKKRLDKLL